MDDFELDVTVSGRVDPSYASDIIERVTLGQVKTLYVTENGANSYSFRKEAASKYIQNLFEDDPELVKPDEQLKTGCYYFKEDGETKLTSLPTPLKYEGPEEVKLQNLAYTNSKQICYTMRADFDSDSEEFVELRNSYSYDISQIQSGEQVKQFFELVGSLEMLLEE